MSEQLSDSEKSETNVRTARTVAAILSQTSTDVLLGKLNETDGRNQSEQASFLASESSFLRELYERGGTIVDGGWLTVPKEYLNLSPEIEITTVRGAVERLTRVTGDAAQAKELAPQFVTMAEQIAGSNSDRATRLKVFGWLYGCLEGKQELLKPSIEKSGERDKRPEISQPQYSERWQQIVELSEAMAALEPKDRLPENSLEDAGESFLNDKNAIALDEHSDEIEIHQAVDHSEEELIGEMVPAGSSSPVGFERIELDSDLPKIPENLSLTDFEKLLEKMSRVDWQLERGVSKREVLRPFKTYVEQTMLDNELRLVEAEYAKIQEKRVTSENDEPSVYRFVATREELRELADDRAALANLKQQEARLKGSIRQSFDGSIDREKIEQSINSSKKSFAVNNQIDASTKPQKIELTEDETELQQLLLREKEVEREINSMLESITKREQSYRPFAELAGEQIAAARRHELLEKAVALELPVSSVLKEKYLELTPQQRQEKLVQANSFEVRTPAEYLLMREAANRQFEVLRRRELNNEYQKFDNSQKIKSATLAEAGRALAEHREKIQQLKILNPVFTYQIEGGRRLINAQASERALAGYDFVASYVKYQLKQPETRLRQESTVYRDFALRLEAARTMSEVTAAAYKIRQENHQAVKIWKTADAEQKSKLSRPLSKNEMTLLFLEQPPRSFSAEMSVLKYNFAHHTEAKARMTEALFQGKLEPSQEAQQLAQSLATRLNRRDFESKQKATRHFFESLKTDHEQLRIKNAFDHRAAYEKLLPHEKDWIYKQASMQRENLEYKLAYERDKSAGISREEPSKNAIITNEVEAASLKQEFAAGTLWHQAALLTDQDGAKDVELNSGSQNEKILRSIGHLIHNQPEAGNLRVAEWLQKQKSEELKTAGEILKTFAGANREVNKNQLTVTLKIEETNRVSAAEYKSLFARYFPANYEKLTEFRLAENQKFRLARFRELGQSAALDAWAQEVPKTIYRAEAPIKVFGQERQHLQEIESIKQAQIECRRHAEIKNSILLKIEEKLKQEFARHSRRISDGNLRTAVESALEPQKTFHLTPPQKKIFELAQDQISITDFGHYRESNERLENGITEINQSFERIAAFRLKNAEYLLAPQMIKPADSLQHRYEAAQHRAEAERITSIARELSATKTPASENDSLTLAEFISDEDREGARAHSHKQARIALEPVELSQTGQNPEILSQAVLYADALEEAHQLSLSKALPAEIKDAFNLAEIERGQFDEFVKDERRRKILPENKPVSLLIYERELARCEKTIVQAKISEKIETGKLSAADVETKNASEIFSEKERREIRLEAGDRTRENLEPKELWERRSNISEKLQRAALGASDALEQAHQLYHQAGGADKKEISHVFSALDASIIHLKNERRAARSAALMENFKLNFKRDLAKLFEHRESFQNPQIVASMTKGLLIDGIEKQTGSPEKINTKKLNEISITIALAISGGKKPENLADKSFDSNRVSLDNNSSENHSYANQPTGHGKHPVPVKQRQVERVR